MSVELEEPYLVPDHLEVQQSFGPFPARTILPLAYATVICGTPLAYSAYTATNGLIPPAIAAALIPAALISPFTAWWLSPPAEHGLLALAGFLKRSYVSPTPAAAPLVAVYRVATTNLETASAAMRRSARVQWGVILNGLTHPIKIIIRSRPLTALPVVERLRDDPREVARDLGSWLEQHMASTPLITRDRLLVVPGAEESELQFRTTALEKTLKQARMAAVRIAPDELPLLRTLTWNPAATESQETPEVLEEGWTETNADGWWTRAYAVGQLPASVLTNWAAPLLAGDEPLDVAIDIEPQDLDFVKRWVVDVKIGQLVSSHPTPARELALEQLRGLRSALERRRVAPFNLAMTVLVRGTSRQNVRDRSVQIEQQTKAMGLKLNVLKWEQAAGLRQMDPTQTTPMRGRTHLIETGTLARLYPWSDSWLQLPDGVPFGEAGNRPCLFTPYVRENKGPHVGWYGMTNSGKGVAAHILWSRLYLLQGFRIFGIDQDEQHEHCGRFLEYLGGRKLTPRDAADTEDIVLHRDDGVVILDLSHIRTDAEAGEIYAAWAEVVKRHMLTHPGRSIFFTDEATRIAASDAGATALARSAERSRHWGQSSHVMTQRPSTWFDSAVGRAIQGNCDAWWCGAQKPRELHEVAEALELADEEREAVRKAGIGQGLLVSGQRRVWLDLYEKLSPAEYAAFNSDPIVDEQTSSERRNGAHASPALHLR